MPQFWAGIVNEKVDIRGVDNGFGGFGEAKHRAPALFTSRKEARRQYKEVRKVEVRIVSKSVSR